MRFLFRWYRVIRSRFSSAFARVDLNYVLSAADPSQSLSARLEWFDTLLEWVRLPASIDSERGSDHLQSSRMKFMFHFLDRHPPLKLRVSQTLQSILVESDPYPMLTDAGIEVEHSFSREFMDRLLEKIIPQHRDPLDLKITFEHIFQSDEDVSWFNNLSENNYKRLNEFIFPDLKSRVDFTNKFFKAVNYSLNSLGIRLCALVESKEVKLRLPRTPPEESPFYKLQRLFASLIISESHCDFADEVSRNIKLALIQIEDVYPHLEISGVSIDLVYKLDTIKSILARSRKLSVLHQAYRHGPMPSEQIRNFIVSLGSGSAERDSLIVFLGSNVNLIARKIVERTSESGENYITRNREEYFEMLRSAAGGGLFTVFTTFIKSAISKMGLPLFFDGIFIGLNYSMSFIGIQLLHFTLATKTPAMTASSLAAKLKDLDTATESQAFVEEVVCLVRSSFAAVLGNLGLVIPGSMLFDLIYWLIFGHHVFSNEYATEQLKAHSPFLSLTLIYAGVTGFILWFSSILGAWVDNWFVYRKQFEVYENSGFLETILGKRLHISSGVFLRKNLTGFATNIALGFLLAFSSVWGKFFGLPLQVRHVTLSAGTLTFSLQGLSSYGDSAWLIMGSALGLICIGLLNFGVSFSLSLFVAARARNIRLGQFPFLIGKILQRFRHKPRDFFLP